MNITDEAREEVATLVEREEAFEFDTHIEYTYDVDPEYKAIVVSMARAIWNHDNKGENSPAFPTGDIYVDDPYICRADDALREGLPLLRAKIANELRADKN